MTDTSTQPISPASNLRGRIRTALYAMSWVFFISTVFLSYQEDALEAAWLTQIAWGLLLTMWCREDAILAQRPLPTMSLWLVFLFWPIAVPVCVLRIYGAIYGLLLVLLHVMIYAVAYATPAILLMMHEY